MIDIKSKTTKDRTWYIVSYYGLNDSLIGGLRMFRLHNFLLQKKFKAKLVLKSKNHIDDSIEIPEASFNKKTKRILNIIFIPDFSIFWSIKVFKFLRNRSDSIVLTSSPPHGLHLLGILLKMFNKQVYWIADFRDPWTINVLYNPSFYKRKINSFIERKIFSLADLILVNSETDRDDYKDIYNFATKKVIVIRNGFESLIKGEKKILLKKIKFVYSGGTYNGIAPKQISLFLDLLNNNKFDAVCDWYGEYDEKIQDYLFIEYKNKLEQSEVPKILSNYEVGIAYLPEESINGGRILQKFYDYIGSGVIPIVINPSKEMVRIMDKLSLGVAITKDLEPDIIIDAISKQILKNRKNQLSFEELKEYSRESQFNKLIEYLF